MVNPPAKLGLGINACAAARFPPWLLIAVFASGHPVVQAEEETETPAESSPWAGKLQFGAGYDTNANGSTREQLFLGFRLDPDFVAAESPFGEVSLGVEHTYEPIAQRGFISTAQLAHRANPDAPFADQTLASLGTEAVWIHGSTRWGAAVSGYSSRLDNADYERGASFQLSVSHSGAGRLETVFTLRTGRIGYPQSDFEIQDVDRYLAGLTFTRIESDEGPVSLGFTLLAGRDVARREDSPFGNTRFGALLSASWRLSEGRTVYAEAAGMRSEYPGVFFDRERRDNQYEAVVWLDARDWPLPAWALTPQLRYVRNDSTLPLFGYDRIEAALYLTRLY